MSVAINHGPSVAMIERIALRKYRLRRRLGRLDEVTCALATTMLRSLKSRADYASIRPGDKDQFRGPYGANTSRHSRIAAP